VLILAALWLLALRTSHAADTPDVACPPVAHIVSIQGTLQILRAGASDWSNVRKLGTTLCQGDLLHADPASRAALLISPETLIRLDQNTTLTISQAADETVVEFSQNTSLLQPIRVAPSSRGAGYVITRFPRKFKVLTPFINAVVEGTEFQVAIRSESDELAVFEGKMLAQELRAAASQAFSLKSGESLSAGATEPAAIKVVVKPVDAVQWALYYPPLSEASTAPGADDACDQAAVDDRVSCLIGRAERRLRTGRVDEAHADIESVLRDSADNGDALALLAIIAITKNEKPRALELAQKATQAATDAYRAWLALSYAQQAEFKLEDALKSAQRAAELAPGSTTPTARVAELLMSLGRIRDAEKAAQAAVAANPAEARAHTVLGFVYLAEIDIKHAKEQFEMAIERDSAAPLPRLGLGLAIIRDGSLREGREQIEIAVVLDPTNSLLRSYVGKAYYEENTKARDKLAATQYGIAKELDAYDPTPWFYDAILKQTRNRPVEALDDLDRSVERNDDRAVYRSRLLLDEDLAARSASLARIYDNLGFKQLGVVESTKSLSLDPTNVSAHRFLSDTYAALPRHEIARASELFQAQMLQPININPVQPSTAEVDLLVLPLAGPANPSFNEYTPLFESNGVQLNLTGAAGNQGMLTDEIVLSGIAGRNSFSLGQYHYQSDGFRPNNDLTHDIYNVFYQAQFSPELSAQFEYRKRNTERGDLQLRFDPSDFSLDDRQDVKVETPRVGLRFSPSPRSDILLSYIYSKRTENKQQLEQDVLVNSTGRSRGNDSQGQYIFRGDRFNVTAGGGRTHVEVELQDVLDFSRVFGEPCPAFLAPVLGDCTSVTHAPVRQSYGYVYTNVAAPRNAVWTLGLGYDDFEQGALGVNQLSPKLGLRWNVTERLQLRLAYLQALKRELTVDQTLEPTQVAGFNQFFDDLNGTSSDLYGVALDAAISPRLYAGLQFSQRNLSVPIDILGTGQFMFESQTQHVDRGYLYWTAGSHWSGNLEVQYEQIERDPTLAAATLRPDQITTLAVPATIRYFQGSGVAPGFFAALGATYVHQRVGLPPSSTFPKDSEYFVVVDAAVGYRLPNRLGILSLQVSNLFDEQFLCQDFNLNSAEPSNPRFAQSRTIVGRIFLRF